MSSKNKKTSEPTQQVRSPLKDVVRSTRKRKLRSPRRRSVSSEREESSDRRETFTIAITASDEIRCPVCPYASRKRSTYLTAKELEAHCKEEHQDIRIIWKCKACLNNKEYSTAHGLRIHAIHCTGGVKPSSELPFKCKECGLSFNTYSGLCQHLRHRHPEELAVIKAERLKGTQGPKPYLVTEEEFAELKRLEERYKGVKQINAKIREHFPDLSCKQISDLRRKKATSKAPPSAKRVKIVEITDAMESESDSSSDE